MDTERLHQQFAFLREIDREKEITRQTWLADGSRKENDAEHAWHMAVMALLLAEYANEKVDVLHTMSMLLIHDLVEIDAGDTFCYDMEGQKTQAAREQAAADRLFALLPEDQGKQLRALWEEFESADTPEARFARTLDRIQPTMLNAAAGGKGWTEHGTSLAQVLQRNACTAQGSQALWEYSRENFVRPFLEAGILKKE